MWGNMNNLINRNYINRRSMQSAAMAFMLLFLGVGAYNVSSKLPVASIKPSQIAGVFSMVNQFDSQAVADNTDMLSGSEVIEVAAVSDQVETDGEYDEWSDVVMADVNDYLYIRESDDTSSQVIGKLRAGDAATLIDIADGWYEIESGNAHGFVSADYCVTGFDAYMLAQDVCVTNAVTKVGGLRVRAEASEEAKILKNVGLGTKLIVDTEAPEVDGWVAVNSAGVKGYVKAEYVDVDMNLGEAITVQEEQEAIEAAKKAKEEAIAAAAQAKAEASVAAANNQAVVASASDVTLLAAIIQIEAGNECYDGQVAVGSVVMNRLRSGYAGSVSGVIYQRGQFSTGRMSSVIAKGPKSSCVQAAQQALAGADVTGGALHFRRAGSKSGLVIGNHVFY